MHISRISVALLSLATLRAAPESPLWEPGKVVAVEQVSTPAKTPDPSCLSIPKGATPPPRCRASNLRAEQFWRVTVDVGNKRFMVRPYRAQTLRDAFNQDAPAYIDPNLTPASAIEVAVISTKAIRFRTGPGQEFPAIVDSQQLLSNTEAPPKLPAPVTFSATKIVLLQNSDFFDLEVQAVSGDRFPGEASPIRAGSSTPVFLVLAEHEADAAATVELSRLEAVNGARQKNRSASSIPIIVTQVTATVRKVTVKDPLPPGDYVLLLKNSNRGFLFSSR